MGLEKEEMFSNASENLLSEVTSKSLEKSKTHESCHSIEITECNDNELSYGVGDAVFSSFAVAPLVVGVWRGLWGLMDMHGNMFPYAQIYILGITIHICFALLRAQLLSRSTGAWSEPMGGAGRWLRERVLSRVYTYVFIMACIMFWRGGWGLLDATVSAIVNDGGPHRPFLYALFTIIFYSCALCLRSSRNFLAPPYFLVTDGKEATYIFTTRFESTPFFYYFGVVTRKEARAMSLYKFFWY